MNNKYWEEEIETMPREQLRELQLQRLKKTVSIAANSPYYKKVFQEHGITACPLVLGDLLALKRLQGVHQPCQQNGPGNAERQNILPVQKCNKRHIAPCFFAREQVNAQHTGALRVQGDMAHNA